MARRIIGPSGSARRRLRLTALVVLASAAATVFFVAGSSANLVGSSFEGGDGNLVVDTSGNLDWANVPGRHVGIDQPSGSSDNSFGQGTKADDPSATIVTGSIPPNKNDLTRFYEASQVVGTGSNQQVYLDLGWERLVNIGNANLDFEINQSATPGFTGAATGPITINRTPGDLLVTYDFGGSGTPTLGLNRWLTSSTVPSIPGFATNTCLSSNTFPCWGDHVALNGTDSEGAVNTTAVTDPILGQSLGVGLFGEAAINLTAAGVFRPNACNSFASTFVKSRSSSSFTAEIKDFIAPQPTVISNCGEIRVVKQTDPAGLNQDFGYSTTGGLSPSTFTLNAAGTTTQDYTNVPQGTYTVTEGAEPTGFGFGSLECTVAGTGTTSTSGATATINLAPNDVTTCTYVNEQQLGAIKITKTSVKGGGLAGATFSVTGPNSFSTSVQSGSDGTVCVGKLPFGTYSVQETAAPNGYAIDNGAASNVSVNTNSTCGDGNEAVFSRTDTPLTDLAVNVKSEASGGTKSNIVCVDSGSNQVGNSPQPPSGNAETAAVTANGLKPGTYTCTVVVDP